MTETSPASQLASAGARRLANGKLPTLISVVIPVYNGAEYIGEQLAALASQCYDGPWEVVVADNGSTDGSADVAHSFANRLPALRVVDATARQGATHARNVGSQAARGDVIFYADADDVVAPDWIAAMAEAMRDHDFVAGRPQSLDDHDHDGPAQLPSGSFEFLPWALGGNCGLRTAIFHEIGGWREDYPHGGDDVDFCWRVQLAGYPLCFVPEARVGYRERGSVTALAKQRFEFGSRAPQLYREFRDHGLQRPPLRRAARNWVWILTRAPYLAMSDRLRRRWVGMTAGAVGRAWGSVQHRVVCL